MLDKATDWAACGPVDRRGSTTACTHGRRQGLLPASGLAGVHCWAVSLCCVRRCNSSLAIYHMCRIDTDDMERTTLPTTPQPPPPAALTCGVASGRRARAHGPATRGASFAPGAQLWRLRTRVAIYGHVAGLLQRPCLVREPVACTQRPGELSCSGAAGCIASGWGVGAHSPRLRSSCRCTACQRAGRGTPHRST